MFNLDTIILSLLCIFLLFVNTRIAYKLYREGPKAFSLTPSWISALPRRSADNYARELFRIGVLLVVSSVLIQVFALSLIVERANIFLGHSGWGSILMAVVKSISDILNLGFAAFGANLAATAVTTQWKDQLDSTHPADDGSPSVSSTPTQNKTKLTSPPKKPSGSKKSTRSASKMKKT